MELTLWRWGIGGEKVCAPERVRVGWRIVIFQDLFLVLILTEVVVKKRFLGHQKKFQKIHKIPLPPAQIQQNSSELIHLC